MWRGGSQFTAKYAIGRYRHIYRCTKFYVFGCSARLVLYKKTGSDRLVRRHLWVLFRGIGGLRGTTCNMSVYRVAVGGLIVALMHTVTVRAYLLHSIVLWNAILRYRNLWLCKSCLFYYIPVNKRVNFNAFWSANETVTFGSDRLLMISAMRLYCENHRDLTGASCWTS